MPTLVLIDLNSQASFEFQYFPNELSTARRVNWRPQETTIGVQPLFYANTSPKTLSFQELWMDNTDTNESLAGILQELEEFLTKEDEDLGEPPAILVTWGDRSERVVVETFEVTEKFFNRDGDPIRVTIRLELIEIQGDAEGVGVNDDDTDHAPFLDQQEWPGVPFV